jgi:hypothetical protein
MAGHFQEFEDEYLETMYEFMSRAEMFVFALEIWLDEWVYLLPRLQR